MATSDSGTEEFFSLDVECVATGRRHDERDVCMVAVVDQSGKVLLKEKVKPEKPVVSYFTPLTGVRAGDLDHAPDLRSVIAKVKALLGPNAVLVGQNVDYYIEWLKLEEGEVDYKRKVDLSEMFKSYNSKYRDFNYFSLAHEAMVLLQIDLSTDPHDAAMDAQTAMKLYNKYHGKREHLEEAKRKLSSRRPAVSFAKRHDYEYEGVCLAAFMPRKCFCGAPTLRK